MSNIFEISQPDVASDDSQQGVKHEPTGPKTKLKAPYLQKLTAEQQTRQIAFRDYRVTHSALRRVLTDLLPLLMTASETNVICVTGATGVGKSTLTKVMLNKLVEDFDPLMEEDASAIPLVYVEARRDGNARNGFGRLYRKLIAALWEPGMSKKVPFTVQGGKVVMNSRAQDTVDELRDLLEDCLKQRKTRVVVIDEAAQLARFGKPEDVMDTIKSLANTTNTKWLLVGSFDLYDILTTNGQTMRRMALLNMERYRKENRDELDDDNDDVKSFKKVVTNLQKAWPCAEKPNFAAVSGELMEMSLGCVGLLKTFMLDAANLQMRKSGEKWNYEFMKKAQKAIGLRGKIEEEILRGEKRVRDAVYGNSLWDDKKFDQIIRLMEAKKVAEASEI
jgi:DNA replication protein DnaC